MREYRDTVCFLQANPFKRSHINEAIIMDPFLHRQRAF